MPIRQGDSIQSLRIRRAFGLHGRLSVHAALGLALLVSTGCGLFGEADPIADGVMTIEQYEEAKRDGRLDELKAKRKKEAVARAPEKKYVGAKVEVGRDKETGGRSVFYDVGTMGDGPSDVRTLLQTLDAKDKAAAEAAEARDTADARDGLARPDELPAAARAERKAEYEKTREELLRLWRRPDPSAIPRLRALIEEPMSPFSPMAAAILGRMRTDGAWRALEAAAGHERYRVRLAVVESLVRWDPQRAAPLCRRLLKTDPKKDVMAAAMVGLALAEDREAIPELRDIAAKDEPGMALVAGWALARMGDPEGLRAIERLTRTSDAGLAARAVATLAELGAMESIPVLHGALFAEHDRVKELALAALDRYPEETVAKALARLPAERARTLRARRALLRQVRGDGERPDLMVTALESANPEERFFATVAAIRTGELAAMPYLIDRLGDPDQAVAEKARAGVAGLIAKHKLSKPPYGIDRDDWRKWWFRQHFLLATAPGKALLLLPGRETRPVAVGSILGFGARVTAIQVGTGEHNLRGGMVTIDAQGRPFTILPEPTESPSP